MSTCDHIDRSLMQPVAKALGHYTAKADAGSFNQVHGKLSQVPQKYPFQYRQAPFIWNRMEGQELHHPQRPTGRQVGQSFIKSFVHIRSKSYMLLYMLDP